MKDFGEGSVKGAKGPRRRRKRKRDTVNATDLNEGK
jgi:hypothetical protein